MIRARATVMRVENGQMWLRLEDRPGGCGRCTEPGGCRSVLLGGICKPYGDAVRIANSLRARVGDQVTISVAEGAPLRAALLGYGLPVVLMLVVAGLVQLVAPFATPDGNALTGVVVGLLIGMLATRWVLKRDWRLDLSVEPSGAVLTDCGRRP